MLRQRRRRSTASAILVAARGGTDDHQPVGHAHSTTGLGFGYGFETVDRYGAKGMASVGSFGWGGAYGTTYWVDPKAHMVAVMMIQLLPGNAGPIADRFNATVYQALLDVPVR